MSIVEINNKNFKYFFLFRNIFHKHKSRKNRKNTKISIENQFLRRMVNNVKHKI